MALPRSDLRVLVTCTASFSDLTVDSPWLGILGEGGWLYIQNQKQASLFVSQP